MVNQCIVLTSEFYVHNSSGIDCPGEIPTSTNTEEKTDSANIGLPNCSPAETSNDVDKQERIERYVRMTIQNQAESMLARNSENVSKLWCHAFIRVFQYTC